ncbi:MAG: magnesium transporter [Candidatus Uhrbacteria bacterium]|nr:magnesium transporter [Patescibacteria group bacterium]MBU1906539.1 magnesium transporter [Patescibacteria group bacterium]
MPNSREDVIKTPVRTSFRHRAPWLIVGLFGGILSAHFISFFESTLERNLILAAFIPMIVYMNDAVGTQLEAFVIRDMSLNRRLNFRRYFLRQFMVVFLIALSASLIIMAYSFLVYQDLRMSEVLGIAMLIGICSSVFTGLIIPRLVSKTRNDPANVSGPIATIIQDMFSVVIYFLIATAILN